eukprot:jgi/Botrbrau1/4506/Bobra.0220s0039.1
MKAGPECTRKCGGIVVKRGVSFIIIAAVGRQLAARRARVVARKIGIWVGETLGCGLSYPTPVTRKRINLRRLILRLFGHERSRGERTPYDFLGAQ